MDIGPHRIKRALLPFVLIAGLLPLAYLTAGPASADSTPPPSPRTDVLLDGNPWKFHKGDVSGAQSPTFDDSAWTAITLPHTWNNRDGEDGGNNYYRGIGWYRTHDTVSSALAGRRLFLQFDGADLVTDVYVNGTLLGEHQGGYSTFRFDATAALTVGADNVIAVKVSNASNADVPPLSADYTFFGGIYRSVHLVATDPVHISMLDYGSSGVYLTPSNVSASSANLQVTVKTWNDGDTAQTVTLNSVLVDAAGTVVQTLTGSQSIAAHSGFTFVQSTTVANPHLWDGQKDPYLYRVDAELQVGSTVTDVVSQPLGLRSYRVDANQGFLLNGHYLDLHGVNMHQDRLDQGWAVTDAQLDQDFGFAVEIGATAIRMAHYPHAQHVYDLADRNGMAIWAEIPLVNHVTASAAFTTNSENQLRELIRQNYNHPSIFFWSIANEQRCCPDPNPLLDQLNTLAHQEDPSRVDTLAVCCVSDTDPIALHTDTRGYNKYFGWYSGVATDFDNWATSFHASNPSLSFGVSEYGAGGSIYQHQSNPPKSVPTSYFHPEEYQAYVHETIWQSMKTKPYIWGKFIWNMFDFASDGRNEGDTAGRNDKGLVTYDRQTRKDAFYWYKANWSSSPFVYITGRRQVNRTSPTTDIKVYANTDSVSLTVNGVPLGTKTSGNHIFLWTGVTLQSGSNTVQAAGVKAAGTYTDSVTWTYSPNVRINAGARMPYTDGGGKFFDVDHYYSAGTASATSATIAGTTDQAEYQTYRYGTFTYAIPVVNGTYTLYLKFVEPTFTASGQRVFSVSAEGQTLVSNLDVYQRVGRNTALQLSFTVTVTDGFLNLGFTPSVNNAIVAAIAAVHQ
jgi:beta-galactosidase